MPGPRTTGEMVSLLLGLVLGNLLPFLYGPSLARCVRRMDARRKSPYVGRK